MADGIYGGANLPFIYWQRFGKVKLPTSIANNFFSDCCFGFTPVAKKGYCLYTLWNGLK